jgi:small subunit ribosomal protein S23e
VQRWAQKRYKKANLGTQFKCNPFGGSSHCKGIVLEKMCAAPEAVPPPWSNLLSLPSARSGIEAKQPNSAIRKCVRAQLIKNGKKIAAFVPRDGCLNFIDENVRAAPSPPPPQQRCQPRRPLAGYTSSARGQRHRLDLAGWPLR